MKVTEEQFVRVWAQAVKNGHNQSWVARELGIGETPVRLRAQRIRGQGTDLPELSKYRQNKAKRLSNIFKQELES